MGIAGLIQLLRSARRIWMSPDKNEAELLREERLEKLQSLKQLFLHDYVEDSQDGTAFDRRMLDAFASVEKWLKDERKVPEFCEDDDCLVLTGLPRRILEIAKEHSENRQSTCPAEIALKFDYRVTTQEAAIECRKLVEAGLLLSEGGLYGYYELTAKGYAAASGPFPAGNCRWATREDFGEHTVYLTENAIVEFEEELVVSHLCLFHSPQHLRDHTAWMESQARESGMTLYTFLYVPDIPCWKMVSAQDTRFTDPVVAHVAFVMR